MAKALPEFTHQYFWDTAVAEINPVKDYYYIIERLIEYGNDPVIKWLASNYLKDQLQEVIKTSRKISRKTAVLWQNYYDLPRDDIRCLNKQYQKTDRTFWNY